MSRSQPELKLGKLVRRPMKAPAAAPNVIIATGHDAFMKVIQRQNRGELTIKSLEHTQRNATVKFRVVYKKPI